MTKSKMTFVGCSFTVGVGLEYEKSDQGNYANIVGKTHDSLVTNLSVGGNSNYNIFISAINELIENEPDYLIVQWTALNRLWLYPGPDTFLYLDFDVKQDFQYRDIVFSKKELQKFSDIFHLLNHDYHNIITLVDYCKIINAVTKNTKIIFINGLVPWTSDLFNSASINDPFAKFGNFTKEILDFENREDSELHTLFSNIHDKLMQLDTTQWVNLIDSMARSQIDYGSDAAHPGYKSHELYATMINDYLKENK